MLELVVSNLLLRIGRGCNFVIMELVTSSSPEEVKSLLAVVNHIAVMEVCYNFKELVELEPTGMAVGNFVIGFGEVVDLN
jgi:hypothetical protein